MTMILAWQWILSQTMRIFLTSVAHKRAMQTTLATLVHRLGYPVRPLSCWSRVEQISLISLDVWYKCLGHVQEGASRLRSPQVCAVQPHTVQGAGTNTLCALVSSTAMSRWCSWLSRRSHNMIALGANDIWRSPVRSWHGTFLFAFFIIFIFGIYSGTVKCHVKAPSGLAAHREVGMVHGTCYKRHLQGRALLN